MTNEEIINRLEQIVLISKEKSSKPPVHLVLAIDNNLILNDLYQEYSSLLKKKISLKLFSKSELSKLDQLSYIKDKLNFLENKAKNSDKAIRLLPDDISDYSDAFSLYKDLSSELSFILNPHFSKKNKNKIPKKTISIINDDVSTSSDTIISSSSNENTLNNFNDSVNASSVDTVVDTTSTDKVFGDDVISLPKSSKLSISLDDDLDSFNNNIEESNKETPNNKSLFDVLNIPFAPANQKLLDDLADIDKILDNLSLSNSPLSDNDSNNINYESEKTDVADSSEETNSESNSPVEPSSFTIGSVVKPLMDVSSYNNPDVIASKDSIYKIVSFVALDENDIVISSSNKVGTSFTDFSSFYPNSNILFILASSPSEVLPSDWNNTDISSDLSRCIGSFSNITSFSLLS